MKQGFPGAGVELRLQGVRRNPLLVEKEEAASLLVREAPKVPMSVSKKNLRWVVWPFLSQFLWPRR